MSLMVQASFFKHDRFVGLWDGEIRNPDAHLNRGTLSPIP